MKAVGFYKKKFTSFGRSLGMEKENYLPFSTDITINSLTTQNGGSELLEYNAYSPNM